VEIERLHRARRRGKGLINVNEGIITNNPLPYCHPHSDTFKANKKVTKGIGEHSKLRAISNTHKRIKMMLIVIYVGNLFVM
jgi:hypothetical protein